MVQIPGAATEKNAIATKVLSLAAPKVVIKTSYGAVNDDNITKTTKFPFQFMHEFLKI